MRGISLASERSITRPILRLALLRLALLRYKVVSLLYLTFFGITVFALGACVWLVLTNRPDGQSKLVGLVALFSTGGVSGLLGYFLLKMDQKEQQSVQYQQLLEIALSHPEGPRKDELLKLVFQQGLSPSQPEVPP